MIGMCKYPDEELKTQYRKLLEELKNSGTEIKNKIQHSLTKGVSKEAALVLKKLYNFY